MKTKVKRIKEDRSKELYRCNLCGKVVDSFEFPWHIAMEHKKEYRAFQVEMGLETVRNGV